MSEDLLDRPGLAQAAAARAHLGPEPAALLRDGMTARQYLDALLHEERFLDAVRFMAWVLPRREAVWWACQCVRHIHRPGDPPPALAAVEAAETWAAAPTDENRRAAFAAAETAVFGTPAGCAAAAAFWSGGSMAPPKRTPVPPPEHLTPVAVANAVQLATVCREPEKAGDKYRLFFGALPRCGDGEKSLERGPRAGREPPGPAAAGITWPATPWRVWARSSATEWRPTYREERIMGMPAARVGDMHECPMVTGPVPHVGGPILPPGCPTVLIGGQPAARIGDEAVCVGPPDVIAMGSTTVLIGGQPAARLGDVTGHGGEIVEGEPTVLIGG